jgi:hypothetical protein
MVKLFAAKHSSLVRQNFIAFCQVWEQSDGFDVLGELSKLLWTSATKLFAVAIYNEL